MFLRKSRSTHQLGLDSHSSLAIVLLDSLIEAFLAADPFKCIHDLAAHLI